MCGDAVSLENNAIAANDALDDTSVGGALGGGIGAGLGAWLGVVDIKKDVEAFVGAGAAVTAEGNSTLDVDTRGYTVKYVSAPARPGGVNVDDGNQPTASDVAFGVPSIPSTSDPKGDNFGTDQLLQGLRVATLGTK